VNTFLPVIPLENIHLKNILSKLHNISLTKIKYKKKIINSSNTECRELWPRKAMKKRELIFLPGKGFLIYSGS